MKKYKDNLVACPLDCYDACQAYSDEKDKIKASDLYITNKKLCTKFHYLLQEDYLKKAIYKDEEVSLDKALSILVQKLQEVNPAKTLYYKGSGNLGRMQYAPRNFFSQYGSKLTKGSLCDGGGGIGIEQGRGATINPSIDRLINSDVIVVWGRNFSITSPHLYELVKDKEFIVIDPVAIPLVKKAKLFMQLTPKTDYELALYLTRLAFMEKVDDVEFLEKYCEGSEWFFELAKNKPLVEYEKNTGICLDKAYEFFEIIKDKSVAIMLGLGVQKYFEGATITRCIDSFAAFLGLHNPNNSAGGLWYLSDSSYGYENLFDTNIKNKKITLCEVDFKDFELCFIQGANPVVSSPNTKRVIEGLEKTFVVYFGISYNDTCKYADLIIPSCSFLSKKDVRLPYGHTQRAISYEVEKKDKNTISEYELASFLIDKFDFESLEDEDYYFNYYKNHKVDYDIFEKFEFIEELEIEPLYRQKKEDEYYLITAKSKKSLNSQFKIDNFVYLNEKEGFEGGREVEISSKYGKAKFIVKIDNAIKEKCAFFYSGNKNTNYLTPYKQDEESNSAMYQEVLVKIR